MFSIFEVEYLYNFSKTVQTEVYISKWTFLKKIRFRLRFNSLRGELYFFVNEIRTSMTDLRFFSYKIP